MNAEISIIIPTFNRIDSLTRTLEKISHSDLIPNEVLVIDQTRETTLAHKIWQICQESVLNINYLHLEKPSSVRARNEGIKIASNDILLFMDDDVDINENTLFNILELYKDDKTAMLAGINSLDKNKNVIASYIFCKASFLKRKQGHVTLAMSGRFSNVSGNKILTEWAMGFFFSVRKSLLLKWNLMFDENLKYYAYGEDIDFSYSYYKKCKEENLNCYMSNLLVVQHNVTKEYRSAKKSVTFMKVLHTYYLCHKHFPGNLKSRIMCNWSLFGDFLKKIATNDNPMDLLKAYIFYLEHRKDILSGIFHYDFFMNL